MREFCLFAYLIQVATSAVVAVALVIFIVGPFSDINFNVRNSSLGLRCDSTFQRLIVFFARNLKQRKQVNAFAQNLMFMGCVCKIFAFVRAQVHQPIQKAMLTPGFFRICQVATTFDDVCRSKIRGSVALVLKFSTCYLKLRIY